MADVIEYLESYFPEVRYHIVFRKDEKHRQQKQLNRHIERLYQSLQAKNTTDKHKQILKTLIG
jgi:hypothetical protein